MPADCDDFGNRKPFADGVERERVLGEMLILAIRTDQVLYADAGMKNARNSAAVADLAKNDVLLQLHLYMLASIDAPRKSNPQSGAGHIENGSVNRPKCAKKAFELGRLVSGVARFRATFGSLRVGVVGRICGRFGNKLGLSARSY